MYGDATLEMVESLVASGADHIALLLRHSAREFNPGMHDLGNPLTDEGRDLSRRLGERLPKTHALRGYASPAERCLETAQLALQAHSSHGGNATRVRPVEGLGVFYVLDQMKMYRMMGELGGMSALIDRWAEGALPVDALMPADQAAWLVVQLVAEKLDQPIADKQIDICVSHDMTLYLVRHCLLKQPPDDGEVEFLDALAVFKRAGRSFIKSHSGAEREIT